MLNKFSKRVLGSLGLLLGAISPFTVSAKVPLQTDSFEGLDLLSSSVKGMELQESGLSDWVLPAHLRKMDGADDLTQSIIGDGERLFPASVLPAVKMEPLVRMKDGKAEISSNFSPKTYAEMEHLSYELVKGCVSSSTKLLEKFQGAGWKINGFSGISGKNPRKEGLDGANEDLAGFVAFQEKTGEAVVVFHGSQDPYDWQNNLDSQMLWGRELNRGTQNPFLFNGRISKGNAERYLSSAKGLYEVLGQFKENKNFHITVTGHSLGGAMGELAVADLATNFAKTVWGQSYNNAESNRVRAYLMSAALVFDKEASEQVEKLVGRHNVIQDAVESDPVYFLSGDSTVEHLSNSYSYGLTAGAMWLAQKMGFVKTSAPQEVAFLYGKGRHIGFEALQSVSEVQKMASGFSNEGVKEKVAEKSWFGRWKTNFIGENVAPIHYGSNQIKQDGSGKLTQGFDTKFIVPETIPARIEKIEQAKAQKQAE
ncbi:MAG: lipase family protein, partial [Alphaproteobacteria bacterium]